MAEGEQKLAWPPTKEDLERLYLHDHLSAMKIAIVYGLKYPSPKTAESTVLHHLKKNRIERRDSAEHIRKVTPEMVDAWIERYQKGESLKQIAGESVSRDGLPSPSQKGIRFEGQGRGANQGGYKTQANSFRW